MSCIQKRAFFKHVRHVCQQRMLVDPECEFWKVCEHDLVVLGGYIAERKVGYLGQRFLGHFPHVHICTARAQCRHMPHFQNVSPAVKPSDAHLCPLQCRVAILRGVWVIEVVLRNQCL
jgi:hypothetical protein